MIKTVFDELTFANSPLERLTPSYAPNTEAGQQLTRLRISANGSERLVVLGVPLIVRSITPEYVGELWPEFCSMLQEFGIPLVCKEKDLEEVPAASLPIRVAGRFADQPFDRNDLQTADLFEIHARGEGESLWGWPAETTRARMLADMLEVTREAAGGDTPVGIELPLAANEVDLQLALNAGVDFLSLQWNRTELDESTLWGIAKARQMAVDKGVPDLPIVVDGQFKHELDLVKSLALGASVTCIDGILRPIFDELLADIPKQRTNTLGGLGSIHRKSQLAALNQARQQMLAVRSCLIDQMLLSGARDLSRFDRSCLRSLSERCALATGVEPLKL